MFPITDQSTNELIGFIRARRPAQPNNICMCVSMGRTRLTGREDSWLREFRWLGSGPTVVVVMQALTSGWVQLRSYNCMSSVCASRHSTQLPSSSSSLTISHVLTDHGQATVIGSVVYHDKLVTRLSRDSQWYQLLHSTFFLFLMLHVVDFDNFYSLQYCYFPPGQWLPYQPQRITTL